MKIERKWRKMKENEEKWKKMKDIIVSIRPRFQPIHWLPFSVAQFFTLSWVEHSSSNIYEYISYHFPSFEYPYLIFVIFFTQAKFLENKIYTEKRQFFALNL